MAIARKAEKTGGSRLVDAMQRRRTGLAEDTALIAAALLVCAFYQMENHRLNVSRIKSMPDLGGLPEWLSLPADWLLTYGMQLFRAGFAGLFIAVLLWLGFRNGILKRWGFLAALTALLGLPQLGLLLLDGTRHADGLRRFLYELSVMLGQWPFVTLQSLLARVLRLGVNLPAVAVLTLGASALAFALGQLLVRRVSVR